MRPNLEAVIVIVLYRAFYGSHLLLPKHNVLLIFLRKSNCQKYIYFIENKMRLSERDGKYNTLPVDSYRPCESWVDNTTPYGSHTSDSTSYYCASSNDTSTTANEATANDATANNATTNDATNMSSITKTDTGSELVIVGLSRVTVE